MLDTIRVKYPIVPTKEQLEHWRYMLSRSQTGVSQKYVYNYKLDEAMLKYTYIPIDYSGNPLLMLELSLPKLLFDNNFQMILGIDSTIKWANLLLNKIPHAPVLDLGEGILIRLDICYNHQVGDMVDDYIKALGRLDYPHRRTKYHLGEGAEYRAKHKTTKFYNKERETGRSEAAGLLRQELTLMSGKDIKKITGIKKPRLTNITRNFVVEQLENDLSKLRLLGNSIATRDTAPKALCKAHGSKAGLYYYALLVLKMDKTKKEIVHETERHPRSLDRDLKKITGAGIPLTLTDRHEPLPPLEIKF